MIGAKVSSPEQRLSAVDVSVIDFLTDSLQANPRLHSLDKGRVVAYPLCRVVGRLREVLSVEREEQLDQQSHAIKAECEYWCFTVL